MKWVSKVKAFFTAQEKPVTVVQEIVTEKRELTEFEKVKTKFNPQTDLLVISEEQTVNLSDDEKQWLHNLGDKVIYFPGKHLINMALVRAGYGWN